MNNKFLFFLTITLSTGLSLMTTSAQIRFNSQFLNFEPITNNNALVFATNQEKGINLNIFSPFHTVEYEVWYQNQSIETGGNVKNAPWGNYLHLDTEDDYVYADDHFELDIGDEDDEHITVEAWIYLSVFSEGDIVSKLGSYELLLSLIHI